MSGQSDRWIRWTTTGCVALLALIAGTVEPHGQPGWVAALSLFSVDGMIVAASTTLLADSRSGGRGGFLPWVLLVAGSMASLATNVAVAQPTAIGRVIAAWPSFALIAAYELLMRQIRCAADAGPFLPRASRPDCVALNASLADGNGSVTDRRVQALEARAARKGVGRELRQEAWRWAQANRTDDGSLPSGRDIGRQHGRHERWGRLIKRSGMAGELNA